MDTEEHNMHAEISEYCSILGKDPLLVQGAGGNVSWKTKKTLWVKASGTWLAEARDKNIFVPVDLCHLQNAICKNNFSINPKLSVNSDFRPSIETILHAIVPFKIVIHLHAVDILSYLVRLNCEMEISELIGNKMSWVIVQYCKPGSALAALVYQAINKGSAFNVVFLKNHGVIIGGESILEVDNTLRSLLALFKLSHRYHNLNSPSLDDFSVGIELYKPISDPNLHQLAIKEVIFDNLATYWALYPDHIVFLGPKPNLYESIENLQQDIDENYQYPDLVFIRNQGVFTKESFNLSKLLQLRCYFDVLIRQNDFDQLNALQNNEVSDLINWDAEKYRMSQAK